MQHLRGLVSRQIFNKPDIAYTTMTTLHFNGGFPNTAQIYIKTSKHSIQLC